MSISNLLRPNFFDVYCKDIEISGNASLGNITINDINGAHVGAMTGVASIVEFSHKDRTGPDHYSFSSTDDGETFINSKFNKSVAITNNGSSGGTIAQFGQTFVDIHEPLTQYDTTQSIDHTTGSIVCSGGLGVRLDANVRGTIHSTVAQTKGGVRVSLDNRQIAPADISNGGVHIPIFTAYNNDNTSPYADAMVFNSWGDSTAGQLNMLALNKSNFGMKLYRGAYGSTGNFSNYMTCVLQSSVGDVNIANDLAVTGALSKGSGSFKIDHPVPSKSATHNLVHSFLEGPQADLYYRGKVTLVQGSATVNIDEASGMTRGTFVLLCTNVQCFTTNEDNFCNTRGNVIGNTLVIEAENKTCNDTISWLVIGERKDKHMLDTGWTDKNGKVIVEPLKPEPEAEDDYGELSHSG